MGEGGRFELLGGSTPQFVVDGADSRLVQIGDGWPWPSSANFGWYGSAGSGATDTVYIASLPDLALSQTGQKDVVD